MIDVDGPPLVYAETPEIPGKPTALVYGALRCSTARSPRRVDFATF